MVASLAEVVLCRVEEAQQPLPELWHVSSAPLKLWDPAGQAQVKVKRNVAGRRVDGQSCRSQVHCGWASGSDAICYCVWPLRFAHVLWRALLSVSVQALAQAFIKTVKGCRRCVDAVGRR